MKKIYVSLILAIIANICIAQNIQFEQVNESVTGFEGVWNASIDYADIDNDKDLDVLITGRDSAIQPIAKLYKNDGLGNFTEVINTPFDGVDHSSVSFADIDGDKDQDLLITGINSSKQRIAKLYKNDSLGNFTEVLNTSIDGVEFSSIEFANVDDDDDLELFITGENSSKEKIAKLYSNDGTGTFTETSSSFEGVYQSSIAFADVNGDDYLDVLVTGENSTFQRVSNLYLNDKSGGFNLSSSQPFVGLLASSVSFSDIDNDNDQDVLITGFNASTQRTTKLYKNDGTGIFTEVENTIFEGLVYAAMSFVDIDNDNDNDLLLVGQNSLNKPTSKLFLNDSLGNFELYKGDPFTGVFVSSVITADFDGDQDVDIIIAGRDSASGFTAKYYINSPCPALGSVDSLIVCDSIKWIDGNTYTNNNNSAAYTLTGKHGCDSTVLLDLTINYSNTGTSILSACDSLTWIDGKTYFANNNVATYTIENNMGCDSVITLDLTINTVSDTTTSVVGNVITSNNVDASYVWLDCDNNKMPISNEEGISFTAMTNGSYAVEITEKGCVDTSSCTSITILGFNDNVFDNTNIAFPNPTTGQFSISLDDTYSVATIKISDINGRVIKTESVYNSQTIELFIAEPAGVYIIAVQAGDQNITMKLVKE